VLRDYAAAFFATPAKVLAEGVLGDPKAASRTNEYTKKVQIKTTDVLAHLEKNVPSDAFCVMAFTMVDLYPADDWNYVFGQASLKERVGVFSFARYEPGFFGEPPKEGDAVLAKRRALGVMAHEIGHMFGLAHCIYFACAMNGSNNLAETDRAPLHLCPVCLRKIWSSVRFDPVARYRAIARIYADLGLDTDRKWVDERIAELA
jgi:archaemetzincin